MINHIIKVAPSRRLVDETVKRIADERGVSINDAMSRSRKRAHIEVRIAAMRAIWEAGGGRYSLHGIGSMFGYDHSTVLHHIKPDEWREKRAALRQRKYYDDYREKRIKNNKKTFR